MKISLIATIFNEDLTIEKFLQSILSQTQKPDQVVLTDGGSKDKTPNLIHDYRKKFADKKIELKFIVKPSNRAKGRNLAIRNSTGNIIICSDAGNILDKDWIKKITKPFDDRKVDIVSGYYKPITSSVFEKSLAAYVCVMPDKLDKKNFLPSSRSIAFRKKVWEKVKYPEHLNTCEDLVFAKKLKEKGFHFYTEDKALVYWQQKATLRQAFKQLFNYAIGDGQAGYIRDNVYLVYARYILGVYFLLLSAVYKSYAGFLIITLGFVGYVIWSIAKNYRYVNDPKALRILPILQFTADIAVLFGTLIGYIKSYRRFRLRRSVSRNRSLFLVLIAYVLIMLLTLRWGAPNFFHPFPYHMDEWHQLNAVRATIAYGTPNVEGSAHGTMFHFLMTGFYLAPFTIAQYINPAEINIEDYTNRIRIFDLLRLNSIIYGMLSIFFLYKITKQLRLNSLITLPLFIFTPIWLLLSGYFKYDIALVFWLTFSLYFILRFAKNPNGINFLIAAVPVGLTTAVKVSGFPIHIIYILAFFLFGLAKIKLKYLFYGTAISVFFAVIFGIPDLLFGRGDIYTYIAFNLLTEPNLAASLVTHTNPYWYLYTKNYPLTFGYGLVVAFVLSTLFFVFKILKNPKSIFRNKEGVFIVSSFLLFLISLLYLGYAGAGNRALVIFPFIVIIISIAFKEALKTKLKPIVILVISLVLISQAVQSLSWIKIKLSKSPQQTASEWIKSNVKKDSTIGLENVPIYQMVPDLIQKEFYNKQYGIEANNIYEYQIIDDKSKELPDIVIVTNGEIESSLVKTSPKKLLLERLKSEGFVEIQTVKPNLDYFYWYGNDLDYYLSGLLIATPLTTTVFEKKN